MLRKVGQFAARMKFEFFMHAFRNNFVLFVSVYTFFIYAKKKVHKGVDVFSPTTSNENYAQHANCRIDLFSLYDLFSQFRPRDVHQGIFRLYFH